MLNVFTIACDPMPWLPCIFSELVKLKIPWKWSIAEGVALPMHDTKWMPGIRPRLSNDSGHEFLRDISQHPNITHVFRTSWDGKVSQCNTALQAFREPGTLLECDADEIWDASRMETLVRFFGEHPDVGTAMFKCNFFVGPNIVTEGEGCYGSQVYEWTRSWRWKPGQFFATHEPPRLMVPGRIASKEETFAAGLHFNHFSYTTRKQCMEKSRLYGKDYADAVGSWERLQKEESGQLNSHFKWVDDKVKFRRLF